MIDFTIAVDSREQRPYSFNGYPTTVKTLQVGDYSIVGLEEHISIERKEVGDLIGCLSFDRDRFERELYKSKSLDYFALVIEGSLKELANGEYRSKMQPQSVIQSLMAFSIRYNLPIFFAEHRQFGQRITESLLIKYIKECEKKINSLEEKND